MRMRIATCCFCCLFILLASPAVPAQPLPLAEPGAVGMSRDRLERIGQMVHRQFAEDKLVAAVTMVARRGKLVHFEAFGKADVEADKPMRKDAIFRIYSMTKPITTVAAMMLYEEGKFQLGDSLSDYLPQFAAVEVYRDGGNESPHRPITVRDLLTHRSGLTYGLFSGTPVDKLYRESNVLDSSGTLKDMVDKLAAIPLLNQPGQKWHYSVSTDVLGYLVEVLSGQPLDEFFQQRIFDPLAMTDTGFYVPMGKKDRFPVNYVWNGEGERRVADHPATSRYLKKPTFHSGGGGLVSTTVDYMRFCQMLLSGGQLDGVRLLSPLGCAGGPGLIGRAVTQSGPPSQSLL